MQVHLVVWYLAQTAAVGLTYHLTALFCCCRHIEEVPAQLSLKIIIQEGAAGLQVQTNKKWMLTPTNEREAIQHHMSREAMTLT